jgi:hypothetical protein
MSALDRINVGRLVSKIKSELARFLADAREQGQGPKFTDEYYRECAERMRTLFPNVAPYEIGPSQVITKFVVKRGRQPIQFIDQEGRLVDNKRPRVRGLRRQRKWAATQIGIMICQVKFTPVLPVESININFVIPNDSASPLVLPEEHSGVQGPTVHV